MPMASIRSLGSGNSMGADHLVFVAGVVYCLMGVIVTPSMEPSASAF